MVALLRLHKRLARCAGRTLLGLALWLVACGGSVTTIPGDDASADEPGQPPDSDVDASNPPGLAPTCPGAVPASPDVGAATEAIELARDEAPWRMRDIAVDATHVYWPAVTQNVWFGRISKVSKSGGPVVVLSENEANPGYLAVDDTHVYWTNNSMNGTVARIRKDGTFRETLGQSPAPFSIAVDGVWAYWTDLEGTIFRVMKTGGEVTEFVTDLDGPQGLALDETHVYWADYGSGRVMRVPKEGGAPEVIVSGQDLVRGVAVDCHAVYWSVQVAAPSALFKLEFPLDQNEPVALARGPVNSILTLDAHFVYGEPGVRARRGGGDVVSLTPPTVSGHGVAVDEGFFYTCDDATGRVLKVAK